MDFLRNVMKVSFLETNVASLDDYEFPKFEKVVFEEEENDWR